MKRIGKQILSFLCAVCMLFSSIGDLSFFAFAAEEGDALPMLTLTATDAEGTAEGTYEVTASFAVNVPAGENKDDYLKSLGQSLKLVVQEITMPKETENTPAPEQTTPENGTATPEQTTPTEDGQNGNGTDATEGEGTTAPETGDPSGETESTETPNNDGDEPGDEPGTETETEPLYESYVNQAKETLKLQDDALKAARVFDIALQSNGINYEHEGAEEISVKEISVKLLKAEDQTTYLTDGKCPDVVLIPHDEDAKPAILSGAVNEAKDTVTFQTKELSTFVLAATTHEQTLTSGSVTVTYAYDNASGIPSYAKLEVSELTEGSDGYSEAVTSATAAVSGKPGMLALTRPFDITLKDPETGDEYTEQPVQISIQFDNLSDYKSVYVVHIHDDPAEVITPTESGNSVTFTANGLSVFVLCAFTDYTYTITGGSEVALSTLFEELDITEIALADVTSSATVKFTNSEYVTVDYTAESGWMLKSVAPFDTTETLTLAVGETTVAIQVTYAEKEIVITPPTVKENLVYNGEAQELITAGSVSDGSAMLYSLSAEGEYSEAIPTAKNAGSYTIYYKAENQETEPDSLEVKIEEKALTITAASESKVYDGYVLSNSGYTADGLATGDVIQSITVEGEQTDVNVSDEPEKPTKPNNLVHGATIVDADNTDVTENYSITYVNGTLEVTKKSITITAASESKVYDGTALTATGYTSTGLADGDSFESVTVTGSQTVVGESENIPSAAVIVRPTEEGAVYVTNNVTNNYDITYKNGTLNVTGKALTITADSESKVYDGTALTKATYTVEGLAEGDSVQSVTVTGSQTNVGINDNIPSEATIVNADGEDVTDDYSIAYKNGTLEVTKKPVKLTAASGVQVYDGSVKTVTGFTVSADGRNLNGVTFPDSVTATGSGTAVGTYYVTFSGVTLNDTTDVTGNYVVAETENGVLRITEAAPITKRLSGFNGNEATYEIIVNPNKLRLNGGNSLTLKDTFTSNQSINYGSVIVEGAEVPYDYSGWTGTFTIPDATSVTITYKTRVSGAAGTVATFSNTSELGVTQYGAFAPWCSATVRETRTVTPTGTDIEGSHGVYYIKLFTYAQNHMDQGLGGSVFRLLDSNQRPIAYRAGDHAGEIVTYTTGDDGYVDVALDDGIISLHKNTVYYLEMITAPVAHNPDGSYTYYQKDNTLYSFLIADDPSYSAGGGVYTYFNGDVLKVRCYSEAAGINVTKRFSGNYSLTDAQKNQIRFVLQKENLATGGWDDVESHTYAEFSYGSINFRAGRAGGPPLEQAVLYRVIEENDALEGVDHSRSVVLSYQRDNQPIQENTNEFELNPDHSTYSFSLVFDNSYVDHKLTVVTLNELTGQRLSGAEFTVHPAQNPTQVVKTYTTDADGSLVIRRGDEDADYASGTAYYVVETKAPDDYLLPKNPEKVYFYFSENGSGVPEGIPAGTTAVDLSISFDTVTIANHTKTVTVPVTVTWAVDGSSTWPDDVSSVEIALYQSVNGDLPEPVERDGSLLTLTLDRTRTFDNTTFTNLPARDTNGNDITYSVVQKEQAALSGYYTSYKVSGTGWYVVRNESAVSVIVVKEWYDLAGNRVTDPSDKPAAVKFDLYRTTTDDTSITTRDALETVLRGLEPVRTNLVLSAENGWTNTVSSLQKHNEAGQPYYYFALERDDSMPRNNEDSYAIVPAGEGTTRKLTIKNTQTPVTVIIRVEDATKIYGQNDPAFTFTTEVQDDACTIDQLVRGEDGNYIVTVKHGAETKQISFTCSREEGEGVGSYAIALTGDASQEGYRVRLDNGTLTITPAQVTVKGSATKVYGDPDPSLVQVTGLKEGDTISYYAYRGIGEQKGTYPITVTGLAKQGNYEITYINDYLTIEPAPVTVTADSISKAYGQADPALTVTIDGLKNNDAASVIKYTISRDKQGTEEGESVGEYAITVTGDAAQGNYTVTFVPGTFTITGHKVTVRAKNLSKTYGNDDPAWEAEVTGLQEGETIEYTFTRPEGEDVGTYVVTPVGATQQGNAEVIYETGILTINKADMTVTPVNIIKALTDPITQDPQLTVAFDGMAERDKGIDPTVVYDEGTKIWTYTYTRDGKTDPEFSFTITRTQGETAGSYIIAASAFGERPKNYNITYKTGIFTILTTYNVVVNQQTRDLVDYTQNPEYSYTARLDLGGIGIENYTAQGFENDALTFNLPADGVSSKTLPIPSGAKLTLTQNTPNPDYTTAITLDGNDVQGTSVEINPVNKSASIVVTHSRITLPVEARAAQRQTTDGKADENGADAVTPLAYLGIPRDSDGNPIPQSAENFIEALDGQGVYNLPEDMYYVPDHASVYDGNTLVAQNLQAIRYENNAWQYSLDNTNFTAFQPGEQLELFYMPQYICRVQADSKQFYTLNEALKHIRDTYSGTGVIEMLIERYTMPAADKLTIGENEVITLTTAASLENPAIILRKPSFSSGHMFNNDKGTSTLTLDRITIDGNGVAATDAMVRSNGTLTVTGNATLQNASGNNGGALYVAGGSATIEKDATFTGNYALNGGAIYYNKGSLSIATENITGNSATNGGALYMAGGTLEISKGGLTGNSATNGGEAYVSGGTLTIGEGGTVSGTATSGGAIFMIGGTVNVTEGTVSDNTAEIGGAFYMEGGTLNISGGTVSGNTATYSGGMLHATGGKVAISGGTVSNNTAGSGNGGAIFYTGPNTVEVSGGTLSGNKAENGLGGAIYQASGESTLSAGNINGGNQAQNGAAICTAGGITNFKGVNITGNIASEGGAVGMAAGTKLNFSGNTKVSDNKNTAGEKRNVYLNVDSDEIINVPADLGSNNIGIYVADNVRATRGEACCSFGGYVSTKNLSKITDDRGIYTEYNYNNKLYWGKPVKFWVRYLPNGNGFPPNTSSGTQLYNGTDYYPKTTENQIYSLVNLLYDNYYSDKISTGYVYAYTFRNGETAFDKYITAINWDAEQRQWVYVLHDGTTYPTDNNAQIVIYYADAAYISIVNNSGYDLTINPLTVMGKTAVGDGYGYTAVINNVTQTTLLPITSGHLTIPKDCSVRLLFPGAKGSAWSLNGTFAAEDGTQIRYTLDRAGGGTEQELPTTATEEGLAFSLNANLLSDAGGIYEILFGDPTPICKVENGGVEHPFTSLNKALEYITAATTTLDVEKTATIEMLLDYQQPKTDILAIPEGYNITLTTAAAKGSEAAAGKAYTYVGDNPIHATISRSSGDMGAAVTSEINASSAVLTNDQCTTTLTIDGIIFDGKALGQGGEGGAVKTANTIVNINHCDFKGYTATRGGAVYVKWGRLTVENSDFTNCKILSNQDKTGGGGIWTTAHDLTVRNCSFINCDCTQYPKNNSSPQGGAIFHNIRNDGADVYKGDSQTFPTGFSKNSTTLIQNCTFKDCIAIGSGGTVESDAWFVDVEGCSFHGSQTTKSGGNGGALNIYTNDSKNIDNSTYLNVINCWFEDCSATNGNTNGGAIRTLCKSVKLSGTTIKNAFSNNTGGALSMTNTGTKLEIYGCTFDNCRANESSGAVYAKATTLTVGDSESYMAYNAETGKYEVVSGTRHTSFTDCTSKKFGGINHDQTGDATITGATFTRCTTTNERAGALYTMTKKLTITDTSFISCSATKDGGAVYNNNGTTWQVLTNCVFDGCTSGTNGGGAYLAATKLTVSGTTVRNCEAVNNGGGIYTGTGGTGADFTDCTFTNNRVTASEGKGGALYHNSNGLTFHRGAIEGNRAAYGGGIYHNGGAFKLNETQFSECFATISGGGIYHGNGTFNFNDAQISECYAVTSGGGIYSKNNLYAYGSIKNCVAGQGGGICSESKLYFTDTANAMTIENCRAKNVTLNEDGTVTVAESFSADNLGGGIYKKSDLFDMKSAMATVKGCSAYDGGGVYYNSAGTLTYTAGNFYGNTAANNGGAIYKNAGTVTMSGGVIGGSEENANHAQFGAAIFVADGQSITIGGGRITHNVAKVGGAVAVGGSNANTQLLFQGSPIVKYNTLEDGTPCNVYLNYDTNGIVRTSGTALTAAAYIGVYVTEDQFDRHGNYTLPFGTYNKTDYLSAFSNDRIYAGGKQGSSNNQIVWCEFVCKITDGVGNLLYQDAACEAPAVFTTLENNGAENTISAFGKLSYSTPSLYQLNNTGSVYSGPYQIQMLVGDYNCTNKMQLKNGTKDITLTTASRTPDECGFYYKGIAEQATIHRNADYVSMLYTSGMSSLVIENITMDGGSKNGRKSTENGGIISVSGGTQVYLNQNTVLRNSNSQAKHGAAVYLNDNAANKLTINGAVISDCVTTASGGGICVINGTITMSSGQITGCSAKNGGGIFIDSKASMTMSGGSITGNSATAEAGGIDLKKEIRFSGNPVVSGNTLNGNPCNLHLINDNNTSIYAEGLGPFAEIGVYTTTGNIRNKHGGDGNPFGTWTDNENLHCFINDVAPALRGMKTTDNNWIYWRANPFLSIGKTVDSDWAADKDAEFDFTVTLKKPDQSGTYEFSGNYENMNFVNGVATFKLKAGQVRTAIGLPFDFIHEGVYYTVTENLPEGQTAYTTKYSHNGGTAVTGTSVTGHFGENMNDDPLLSSSVSSVVFTNARTTDDLTVSKTVTEGNTGDYTIPFSFTLTTLSDLTLTKIFNAKRYQNATDTTGTDETVAITNGVGTFQLTHGQSIKIIGLPAELGFTVEENLTQDQNANFQTYVKAGDAEEILSYSAKGKIGELKNVAFRNNRYGLVCKIVNDTTGREQLYYRENNDENADSTPAIFDELEKAFEAISGGISFITVDGASADPKLRIEMVKPHYKMKRQATLGEGYNVTLGTALKTDRLYPYPSDAETYAVVTRGYIGDSMIVDNGNLTIDNITLDGGSKPDKDGKTYTSTENGGIVRVSGAQTLTVTNRATLRNSATSGNGGAISLGEKAGLVMNGTITNCQAENGGGVYAADGFGGGRTMDVGVTVGGIISDCTAANGNGGALFAGKSQSEFTGTPVSLTGSAHLTGNTAVFGGAIYSTANVEIKDSVSVSVSGNTARTDGGGLYLASGVSLNMTGGAVCGNTAKNGDGGGVWGQNVALTDSTFSDNKAENGNGGAIYTNPGNETVTTTVTIGEGTSFTDNQAKQGGALYAQADSTTFTNATMTGNIASVSGGAVYVLGEHSFTMSGGEIRGNSSPEGAISTGEAAALHFSGDAAVTENTNDSASDPVAMNVYLGYHSNTVINASGLSGSGKIGVYAADGEDYLIYNNHGIANRPFGTGSGENLDKFVNDRDNTLTGVQGPDGLIMWPGKTLVIQVYQNKANQQGQKTTPVGEAQFSLANEDGVPLWTGWSNAETNLLPGQIIIPWGSTETENGGNAAFAKWNDGSVVPVSYILTQLQANADTVRPAGKWKLTVGTDNTVTWEVIEPTDAEGKPVPEVNRTLQLEPASGAHIGDTFQLFNDVKPTITFDPNGGILSGRENSAPRTDTIGFEPDELRHLYTITERSPTKANAVFRAWSDGNKEYTQGDTLLFYRGTDNDDVTLTALWETVVCKITDRNDNLLYVNGSPAVYMSLKEGFDAFNKAHFTLSNGTNATPRKIKMLVGSYTMTEQVELARGKIAEFTTASSTDNDGYAGPASPCVISRASSFDSGSMIVDNYSLTIRDLILDGTVKDSSGQVKTLEGNGGIVAVHGNASNLTLASGATLRNASINGKGGAIYAENTTTVTVSGGSAITGCRAQQGGAIYGYTVNVNGGTIGGQGILCNNATAIGDNAAAQGGAIYAAGSMNMTGGSITGNYASANGNGAVAQGGAVYAAGSMNMTGGSITGNSADYGGGVYSNNTVILSNSSATISGNTAQKDGGGIYVGEEGSLSLSAGSIGAAGSPNIAIHGSGVYLAGAAKLSGGSISYNGTDEEESFGGGLYLNLSTRLKVTLEGTKLSQNLATDGAGLYARTDGDYLTPITLTFANGSISGNTASGRGGGVYLAPNLRFQVTGGNLDGNSANLGGGAYVHSGSEMTLSGGSVSKNKATGNGAGIYVEGYRDASYGILNIESGSVSDNSATAYGGAVYLQGYGQLHASGGTISGNSAGNADGGAINVEGIYARIYLSGSPTIFNNPGNASSTQQKNLVLSVDQNTIINTEAAGLKDKQTRGIDGMIGIYVIDGQYSQHGVYGKPFGTFGDTVEENRVNAKNLVNDRNLGLYGVKKEDDTIYWQDVVCKVTNASDEILYKLVNVDNSGVQVYVPAVYTSLTEGLNAISGNLYRKSGSRYAAANTGAVKVKMLLDYTLKESEIITYTTARNVTLTTAETVSGDGYVYVPPVAAEGEKQTKATLTRAQASSSMFTVRLSGHSFDLSNIIIDGGSSTMMTAPGVNGGALRIESGTSTVSGVTMKNLNATGKGGAIYVGANTTATLSNSAINGCTASQGAGIYLDGSGTLNLSGNLNFGGTSANDDALIADTAVGNFVSMDAASLKGDATDEPTNGGMQYPKDGEGFLVRQDIYVSGSAYTLAVTGKITSGNGTIWVWADDVSHYEMLKPFATFSGSGTRLGSADKESSMKAFRNAQPDSKTICGGDYLTGQSGAEANRIFWTGGFDAVFLKLDSFGNPLPGACFTLYTDPDCKEEHKFEMTFSDSKRATTVSSDGKATYKDRNGNTVTLQKGEVLLSKVPPKTFYLKETTPADGFDRDENKTTVYQVVMNGQGGFTMLTKGAGDAFDTEVLKETRNSVERYVIMNIPKAEREVILRKVNSSYVPVQGAVFEILRYDGTPVSSTDVSGTKTTSFTSGENGVYFIDMLPYGKYFLHEIQKSGSTVNYWYTLTVSASGVICSTQRGSK